MTVEDLLHPRVSLQHLPKSASEPVIEGTRLFAKLLQPMVLDEVREAANGGPDDCRPEASSAPDVNTGA